MSSTAAPPATPDVATPDTGSPDPAATAAFAEKLFEAILGAQLTQAVYLGHHLGWYRSLAQDGPATSAELAARTTSAERYAREWLEHQAVAGVLETDDASAEPSDRRYRLPGPQATVLADVDSLDYLTPVVRLVAAGGAHLDRLVEVYRTGGGLGWGEMGAEVRQAQADQNRALFLQALGREYLPGVADVDAALRAGGSVADVGCGGGWSSIGIAQAYPEATVDAFDVDEPTVALARANVDAAGVGDRVQIHQVDAATLASAGTYDLVCAFECIHDLPDPVAVLASMASLAGDEGAVIVMDEAVADSFATDNPIDQVMYGFSLMFCLPDGLSHDPSAATGTVMRPDTLRSYARAAGFSDVEVLAIDNDFFRFYRLRR